MYKGQGVTVVIPTKNELENLKRLLPTIPEFVDEVLVVDGYSSDGTSEYAEKSDSVTKVLMQKAPGKGSALCLGAQMASFKNIICIKEQIVKQYRVDLKSWSVYLFLVLPKKQEINRNDYSNFIN